MTWLQGSEVVLIAFSSFLLGAYVQDRHWRKVIRERFKFHV